MAPVEDEIGRQKKEKPNRWARIRYRKKAELSVDQGVGRGQAGEDEEVQNLLSDAQNEVTDGFLEMVDPDAVHTRIGDLEEDRRDEKEDEVDHFDFELHTGTAVYPKANAIPAGKAPISRGKRHPVQTFDSRMEVPELRGYRYF
jgi:hypothetical protein